MAHEINKVSWRNRAKPRRAPYWKLYSSGRYIGWRKMSSDTPGTWLARAWDGQNYPQTALGDFADKPDEERYNEALAEAVKWFQHLDLGGSAEPHSVRAACEAYLAKQKMEKSDRAEKDAEGFFKRLVYNDPISNTLLSKLKRKSMSAYRARVLTYCDGNKASFNRCVTPLRAALNLAHEEGMVASDQAWLVPLKPFSKKQGGGGKRRTLYLEPADRRRLVECVSDEARPFLRTLNLLPMRPGEVAELRVEYLKVHERALEITGKTEPRVIPLTDEAVAHFKALAKDKLPSAWLVSRADGSQWKKEAWKREVKEAAKKAKLPRATVAYTLRHSVITDLVKGGLDLFHVAQLAGTSVTMISEVYGHMQGDHARGALEKLALA